MDGMVVAHCDWGKDPKKRWMAVASRPAGGHFTAAATAMVGSTATLLDRLRVIAGPRPVLIGFDFPIGVPKAYADAAGIASFPDFLKFLAASAAPMFFEPAVEIGDISADRPFYPQRSKGSKRQHLVDALGLDGWDELFRICERGTEDRSPASPLFWLVGAQQVGRAAIAGWRDLIAPSLAREDVRLWPFDGDIDALAVEGQTVLLETYPADFYRQLGAVPGPGGKRAQHGRAPACGALRAAVARLEVQLTEDGEAELDDAFGDRPDGEDRFDAFVGLVGMLNVLLGGRQPGPPAEAFDDATTVEGWILGQTTIRNSGESAVPTASASRLVDLLRRRNAIDHEIARLIGRPALLGHIGEFIAAELFDIALQTHANAPGSDGIFRSGPLAGRTVNVKFYGRRDGLLDIPEAPVDHLLVLTGPPTTSPAKDSRPVVVDEVFVFDTDELVATLRDRGVAVGTASSLRRDDWRRAQAWPDGPRSVQLPLSEAQMLRLLSLGQG